MRVVVSKEFSEKGQIVDIEPFTFDNRLVQVLWSPEFTLLVERNHVVEENATLVRWHVKEFNVCKCFFSQIAGRQIGYNQTMLACYRRHR